MAESIKQRPGAHRPRIEETELRKVLDAALADLTALRAAVVAITAKLDADAGVTDTNYAATCNPAALTLTS